MSYDESRGAAIRRRLDALGISDREFHKETGVDRKTLGRVVADAPTTRTNTYRTIEDWLDRQERQNAGLPEDYRAPVIVRLKNEYGEVVVEASTGQTSDELAELALRLLRGLSDQAGG